MRYSTKRIRFDLFNIHDGNFIQKCKWGNPNHFIRNRKMPLTQLILSVPFRKGRTLYRELKYFKEMFKMKSQISKQGYLQQRLKLNPEAFLELMRFHAKNFYDDPHSVKKWKNKYIVLATDGSSCNVPLTRENVETYGNTSKRGGKERPQIGISSLFDVVNRMIIDMNTGMCKLDEREEALNHIDGAAEVIGSAHAIYVFDRGYPSGPFFIELLERGIKFVARLSSVCFKQEQQSMKSCDEWKDIIFTDSRVNAQMKAGNVDKAIKMSAIGKLHLRFVKIKLETGTDEYLITNIPEEEVNTDEISELYRMRWCIETAYDDMKNKLELENFTGSKPVIMEQDIYATGYLYNVMSDIMQDAERERNEEDKKYKYKMQINRNIAAGVVKEEVIKLLLTRSRAKQEKIMDGIVQEINRNLLPVREGRKYPRTHGQLASKYSNVKKRSY